MFKYRLSKWGFRKYLSADEARRVMSNIATGEKTELPFVQGRRLGSKKLKAHAERANLLRMLVGQHIIRKACLHGRVEAPDTLHAFENALCLTRAKAAGSLSLGDAQLPTTELEVRECWTQIDTASQWWADIQLATSQLKRRLDCPAGFARLSSCFARYGTEQSMVDFSTTWCTYNSIVLLYELSEDLGNMFCKYVINLSSIRLGQSHPNTRRWAELLRFDKDSRREAIACLMQEECALVQEYSQPENPLSMTIAVLSLGHLCEEGLVNTKTGAFRLGENIGSSGSRGDKQSASRHYFLNPTINLAKSLQSAYTGSSAALSWHNMSLQILQQLAETHPSIAPGIIIDVLYFISGVMDCINTVSSSEQYLIVALDMLRERTPEDHCRIGMAYSKLQSIRLRRGDVVGAEAARFLHAAWKAETEAAQDHRSLPILSSRRVSQTQYPSDGGAPIKEDLNEQKWKEEYPSY